MKIDMRLLGLLAGTAMLAACGGGDAPAEPEAPADTAEAPATTDDAPEAETVAADSTDTVDGTVFADFTGDAAAGEQVFAQCAACHVLDPGQNRIGPSLAGIIGREAGTVEGFTYSPANADSGITWTPEKMFQYLENPQRVVPGTIMTFAGLPAAQDRADVIAYIASHGGE